MTMLGSPARALIIGRVVEIYRRLEQLPLWRTPGGREVYVLTRIALEDIKKEFNAIQGDLDGICKNCTARANGEQENHHKSKDTL